MTRNDVRYIGAQVDKELHKIIKMRCAELGIDLKNAMIEGLLQRLDLPQGLALITKDETDRSNDTQE